MKKLLAIMLCGLVLSGCSSKVTETICTLKNSGVELTSTLKATGDQVDHFEDVYLIPFVAELEELGEGYTVKELVSFYKETYKVSSLNKIEGVEASVENDEENIIITTVVDLSKADLNVLIDNSLISLDGKITEESFLSLSRTVDTFSKDKGSCKSEVIK